MMYSSCSLYYLRQKVSVVSKLINIHRQDSTQAKLSSLDFTSFTVTIRKKQIKSYL